MVIALILGLLLGFPVFLALLLPRDAAGHYGSIVCRKHADADRAIMGGADNTPLLAIPLFMLSGAIMSEGGISKKLFNVFALMAGKKTAGMPIAVVITCTFYGAICGSGPATTAAVGAMAIPILISLGYDKVFAATLCAAAGGIGIIIPPSIPFIMYGTLTSTSVGDLFTAGFIPVS
jgi:C4-dicarboxylate transporter DctM subunit